MKAPEFPANESARLERIYRLDILDTPPEGVYDDFTRLASICCETRYATVSIIDANRQWFKSVTGPLGATETPRDVSFCGHTILQNQVFVIEDTHKDERFADNPLVTGEPKIRFYAGAPLITKDGLALGTLCIFDPEPKALKQTQIDALELLAKQVTAKLEQRLTDALIENLGALLDVSNTYVIVIDPSTERVTYMNPALAKRLPINHFDTSRYLLSSLFPDLEYEALVHPDQSEHGALTPINTRAVFRDDPTANAEIRVLPHIADGRHAWLVLFHDRTELRRSQSRELEAQSNLRIFSRVATQTHNCVIIADAEGRIQWVNDSFEKLTGFRAAEAIGEKPGDLLQGPETAEAHKDRIRRHLAQGIPVSQEILNYTKKGKPYWTEVYIEPIKDDRGQLSHYVSTQVDVTHRKEQEQALREARHAAEQANQSKSQFLANISHEIRTPLNGIVGITENLLENVPPELKDAAQTLEQSSKHLLNLLNDLLDLSQMESGKLKLVNKPAMIPDILRDIHLLFEPKAETVNTRIFVDTDSDLNRWVSIDETRLKQVLMNLANNAVKFTHNGTIQISAKRLPSIPGMATEKSCRIHFAIKDTGPGIAPDDQQRIFDSFEQSDNSSTRVHGGTGLGLAISNQLVNAMGGQLQLESEIGQGACFSFTLELEEVSPPEKKDNKSLSADGIVHALVVDDNEVNRKVLTAMLRKKGVQHVYQAHSARRAMALLNNLQPDAVFIDLHMPEIDGIEMLHSMKQEFVERGRPLPVAIACTADVAEEHVERCLREGFDFHLGKPVTGQSLGDLLALVAKQYVPQPEEASSQRKLEKRVAILDIDALKRSFVDSDDMTRNFLELMLDNLPTQMETIETALASADLPSHSGAAHTLKGLVGYFQDDDILSQAEELQKAMERADEHLARSTYQSIQPWLLSLLEDIQLELPKITDAIRAG